MSPKLVAISLLALVGLLLSPLVSAHRPRPAPPRYSLSLEDVSGARLRTFQYQGETFVLGHYGQRYNVRVRNHTPQRVEAVVSVDGRDAVTGQVGNYYLNRGYVVPAYGSVLIEGFRQSLDAVAAFRFTDRNDSYSTRMGTPEHNGVVGVAIFTERVQRRYPVRPRPRTYDDEKSRSSAPRKSARPVPYRERRAEHWRSSRDNLGTQYGETQHSPVSEVRFKRASESPTRILSVRYDDAEGLRARGIQLDPPRPRPQPVYWRDPQPFPDRHFAPPPP